MRLKKINGKIPAEIDEGKHHHVINFDESFLAGGGVRVIDEALITNIRIKNISTSKLVTSEAEGRACFR